MIPTMSSNSLLHARAKAFPVILVAIVALFLAHQRFPAWFAPKDAGFGMKPVTWQGWTVAIVVIGAVVMTLRAMREKP